jgi:hypothetical protein
VASFLLDYGVKVDEANEEAFNALGYALATSRSEVAQVLLTSERAFKVSAITIAYLVRNTIGSEGLFILTSGRRHPAVT